MSNARLASPRLVLNCYTILPVLALVMMAWLIAGPSPAGAHAELSRSDPPTDGLALTAPENLTMTFTEEVVRDAPAPAVTLLDATGAVVGSDPLAIGVSEDPRVLVVDVPDLDRGTYTVSWTVTSATDGHTLSGAYAFRVGGGLPPGLAATAEATPAPWAVATRWLTFLGISLAAGLYLFGEVFVAKGTANATWTRQRSRFILFGSLLALAATVLEPIVQWFRTDRGAGVSFNETLDSLPDAWWWRPALLIPLSVLGCVLAFRQPRQVSRLIAGLGALLALGALLGLSLTSHAAGRETYRLVAIVADILHQVSVALWTGGLVAVVIWALTRSGDGPGLHLRRFSNAALGLVVVAIVTGVVNTGFVFPFVDQARQDGWSRAVFRPLWTSNYGVILLVKVLVLLVPLALAAYHRQRIARIGASMQDLPRLMRRTLTTELALVALVVLGGSAMALSAPPAADRNVLDRVTLVASTSAEPEPDTVLVHLTIDPARAGENEISARLTDWDGVAIPSDPAPSIALTFTSLDHGTVSAGVGMRLDETDGSTYRTAGLNLSLDGWWQIDARVNLAGRPAQEARFYAVLPDPNTQGFSAAPRPTSDPAAEALYISAYERMLGWERVRWTETLGSGNDALVRARFAVVDAPAEDPDAYSLDVVYSGGFAPTSSGDPPSAPTRNSRHSITVGDQGWLRTEGGVWLEAPPTQFSTPAEWDNIYHGGENFRLGITQEIDGVDYQVMTFYLPEQTAQAEAWFAWWINTDTGNVERVAMIARQHYMSWTYTDIDGDVRIEPPPP